MAHYEKKRWLPTHEGTTRRERTGGWYEAYIPDPLSGRKVFLEGETAADISDAERAIIELNSNAVSLRNTEALARLILRAEALSSSRIEGLVIGPRRILKAESQGAVEDARAQEVLNNINAMDAALGYAVGEAISVEAICKLHKILLEHTGMESYIGEIRKEQNWLGGNAYNPVGAAYVPPPFELVPDLLEDLVAFCNSDTLSPLAQAAIAHAQFETIHPFVDGNGRVGRALVHVILRRRGMCPKVVPPISLAIATRSKEYRKELSLFRYAGASAEEDAVERLNSWLAFFASCTLSACSNAFAFEERIDSIKRGWLEAIGDARTASLEEFADTIVGNPIFTAKQIEELMNRTAPTVNVAIEAFSKIGAIAQVSAGKRNRVFEAKGIIETFIGLERNLASIADDTETEKPNRPVPFHPGSLQ